MKVIANNGSPDFFFLTAFGVALRKFSLTPPREQIGSFTELSFGANLLLSLCAGINVNQVTAHYQTPGRNTRILYPLSRILAESHSAFCQLIFLGAPTLAEKSKIRKQDHVSLSRAEV
jgi:hypothetical protein